MPRIALFGLGRVAQQLHLPACASLSNVQVVAGCDPDASRQQWARRAGVRALYTDPATLLAQEKPDVVIVGTPPDSHADLCLLALDHGAHVLCEKPFVQDLDEADRVIDMAQRRGRALVVNNEYRLMPIYRRAHERIASGEYGRPFLIQCWQQMFHPSWKERNWRATLIQSALYEFGTHPIDLMCFFFGSLPLSITANMARPRGEMQADVVVQAALRFPDERLATLTLNRISHAAERYLEMRVDCEHASVRISFGGVARLVVEWSRALGRPTGSFSLVRGGEARVEAGGTSRALVRDLTDSRATATALKLRQLLDAVQQEYRSTDDARHARELIRIVLAGYESARRGETVWLRTPPS